MENQTEKTNTKLSLSLGGWLRQYQKTILEEWFNLGLEDGMNYYYPRDLPFYSKDCEKEYLRGFETGEDIIHDARYLF